MTKLLFFLKPNSIVVYNDQTDDNLNIEFPPELLYHQDIIDQEKFSKFFEESLSQFSLEDMETLILVSTPLLYTKELPIEQADIDRSKLQSFLEQVPFDPINLATLELRNKESSLIVATNSYLYKKVIEVIQKLGGKVGGVLPSLIYQELSQKETLGPDDIKEVFHDKQALKTTNFLIASQLYQSATPTTPVSKSSEDPDEDEDEKPKSNHLLIYACIAFMALGLIILGFMTGIIKNPLNKPAQPSPTPSSSPTTTPEPAPASSSATPVSTSSAGLQEISRDKLSVEIINGTATSGQAGKTRDLLTSLGFTQITVSDTTLTNSTQTLVTFSKKVSTNIKDELTKQLETLFTKVSPREASESANPDITITTGPYLNTQP